MLVILTSVQCLFILQNKGIMDYDTLSGTFSYYMAHCIEEGSECDVLL